MEIEKIQTKSQAIEEIKKLQARINNLLGIIDLERKEHVKLEKKLYAQANVTGRFVLRELRIRCSYSDVHNLTFQLEEEYLQDKKKKTK